MKTILLIAFVLTSIAGCAQNNKTVMETKPNETDEQEILATVRRFTDLMIARDTAELGKITDADFTLTHITGRKQSRADWFAEIEAESMKYYGYEEVSTSVKTDGDRAEFTGRNRLDARIWGSRNTWRLQQVMQLEKRGGKWIILNSVASTF